MSFCTSMPDLPGSMRSSRTGVIKIVFDLFQALFAGCCGVRGQAFGIQQQFDAFSDFLLIINDEDDSFSFRHLLAFLTKGNSNLNDVPTPGLLSTEMFPPCSCTIP